MRTLSDQINEDPEYEDMIITCGEKHLCGYTLYIHWVEVNMSEEYQEGLIVYHHRVGEGPDHLQGRVCGVLTSEPLILNQLSSWIKTDTVPTACRIDQKDKEWGIKKVPIEKRKRTA